MPLHGNWKFRQANTELWRPATVPGCVHTDLLQNGVIEDPFYRTNEKSLQWIDKQDWEYLTEFEVGADWMAFSQLELYFKGLDTYAEVSVNGSPVLSADNMFREWAVDVKRYLKAGKNSLRILFRSPIQVGLKKLEAHDYPLPAVNDQSENGELGDKKVSVFTRKAGYHFGWDWGPRFVTSGIWRPILLRGWNDARLLDVQIVQRELTDEMAQMRAIATVQVTTPGDYTISLNIAGAKDAKATRTISLNKGSQQIELDFNIVKPKRWWSNGLGEPFLYHVQTVLSKNKALLGQRTDAIGLRTLRIVQEPDKAGKSFYVELNGVPVFMKGANYIPSDNFLNRVTPAEYERIVRLAVDANMNMLRVWGGGIYEADIFYDLCDRYGILVWQDFMFGCSMYPGDAAFLENVRQEAVDNVRRLRNHPSIALWCGNNEVDVAWQQYDEKGGWGWKQQYNATQRTAIWAAYEQVFHRILPEVVKANDPDRFYWPSSPMAGEGKHAGYETQSGDIHYWGVWHGLHRFEDFRKYVGRFMSEYGFQSFPEIKSVKSYTLPSDWDIESEVMAAHQRSGIGNLRIKQYMDWYYKTPPDFESFLYVGQVLQAEAIKSAIETHRRRMPHNMGTLYWQINDCWPVASWSSTDYYRRWKALHYFVRKAYGEVLVSPIIEGERVEVHIVSDRLRPIEAKLELNLLDFKGNEKYGVHKAISLPANSSGNYYALPIAELLKGNSPNEVFLHVKVTEGNALLSENNLLLVPPKDLQLPKPTVEWQIRQEVGGASISLQSNVFAKNIFLETAGEAFFSDNYFDLLPKESVTVFCRTNMTIAELEKQLRVRTLGD
ncbi:MAG: glycoside hydrolase family 2 protein [Saprospiraceae bacterium]|nr:glycoside hydrolase family 2 protein [Saprospiraceae bacterium]